MNIVLASDRAGNDLRDALAAHLTREGYQVLNLHDPEGEVDYPDMAARLCGEITSGNCPVGILICGSGVGMSIAANKIRGIRAAVAADEYTARMCRMHNNANVLCLGSRTTGTDKALGLADAYLNASYEGGRHDRRIAKIAALEENF